MNGGLYAKSNGPIFKKTIDGILLAIYIKLIKYQGTIMKRMTVVLIFMLTFGITFTGIGKNVSAEEVDETDILISDIEKLTGNDLAGYNDVEYNDPITENFDGKTEVLLGYFESTENSTGNSQLMDYREYDRWKVYDQGITKSWAYLSKPYFIRSIPVYKKL